MDRTHGARRDARQRILGVFQSMGLQVTLGLIAGTEPINIQRLSWLPERWELDRSEVYEVNSGEKPQGVKNSDIVEILTKACRAQGKQSDLTVYKASDVFLSDMATDVVAVHVIKRG